MSIIYFKSVHPGSRILAFEADPYFFIIVYPCVRTGIPLPNAYNL